MKSFTLAVILAAAVTAVAQEPEKLTATEVLAINQVATEINKTSQDALAIQSEIQATHKGYSYDFRTGQLVKVVPVLKPEAQPKTETRTKTAPESPVPAPVTPKK